MPKKLDDCVKALIADGYGENDAWAICTARMGEDFEDAEYQGEAVTLNKPFITPNESKKFAVFVKNNRGNIIKVRFGDPDAEIKPDDDENKKSFRERLKCDQRSDKTTPIYWACKLLGGAQSQEIADSRLRKSFADKACFDAEKKYCFSVRDGVQEYHASELGLDGDRMVKVYRSPETIAKIADALNGLKVTNDHVPLAEIEEDLILGEIFDSELVEHFDEDSNSTLLIRNGIKLSDKMVKLLADGKKELSLGYRADMIDSELYDFEVINIEPHHLALVDRARCGKACTFEDREVKPMDFKTLFADAGIIAKDEEGAVNMAKVMELVKELPELVKTASLDELKALVPILEEIMAKAKQGDEAEDTTGQAAEEEAATDENPADGKMQDEEGEDKQKMSDAKFADAVAKKAQELADQKLAVIAKAKDFLGDDYDYSVSTQKIMADAVKSQHGEIFEDAELQTAFKMLKKVTSYDGFGASKALDPYILIGEKEI